MLERLRLGQPALSAIVCLMLACPTAASCQVEPSTQTNTAINGPVGTANNPLKVSSGIMAGRLINREMPVYPASEGPYKSGAVVLRATITPEGKVDKLVVISCHDSLRKRALEAVQLWTYKPYQLNGTAVWVQTTITLHLDFGG